MFVFDDIFKLPQETIDQIFPAVKEHETLGEEMAKALKALDESVDGGFFCYSYIESDPLTNPIHNHPKFKQIVEKAKLRHELYVKRFGAEIKSLIGMAS